MNPGAKIKTADGKLARVIWTSADEVGVFYLADRGCGYGVLPWSSIELLADEKPFASLDTMSLDELKARLYTVMASQPKKKASKNKLEMAEMLGLLTEEQLQSLLKALKEG